MNHVGKVLLKCQNSMAVQTRENWSKLQKNV